MIKRYEEMEHSFFAIMPPNLLFDRSVTNGEKMVYLAVAARANSTRDMWASNRRIGEDIGMSKNRVSATIKKLVNKGYLKTEEIDGIRHVFTLSANVEGVTVGGKGGLPQAVRGVTVGGNHKKKKEEVKVKNNIYGEFKHVKLTDKQYSTLLSDWGLPVLNFYIKALDEYLENNRKKHYDNHLLTMRNFKKKDDNLINSSSPSSPIGRRSFAPCIECGVERDLINNLCEECRSNKNG